MLFPRRSRARRSAASRPATRSTSSLRSAPANRSAATTSRGTSTVTAAQFATPDAINFMATHARGLICLSLTEERCDELGLRPMTERNEARLGTAFTVSIEAREGVTTGISAHDRSHTVQVAIHPDTKPD